MNICQDHWDRLREAIAERGLMGLVAGSGELAVEQLASQVETDEVTPTNFDPLMDAFFSIGMNGGQTISRAGGSPLYLMTANEDPVEGYPGYEDRTWPKCVLCYLGLAHEMTCNDPRCELPTVDGYAWMIERAADDALEKAKELGLRD